MNRPELGASSSRTPAHELLLLAAAADEKKSARCRIRRCFAVQPEDLFRRAALHALGGRRAAKCVLRKALPVPLAQSVGHLRCSRTSRAVQLRLPYDPVEMLDDPLTSGVGAAGPPATADMTGASTAAADNGGSSFFGDSFVEAWGAPPGKFLEVRWIALRLGHRS